SVARDASGEGFRLSRASRARMKLSIGFRGHFESPAEGTSGRFGGIYDQCISHLAPWSIHFLTNSTCAGVNERSEYEGGMRFDLSVALMRWKRRLAAESPETMTGFPERSANMPSLKSNRKLAIRCFSSGPWQAKQLSERIGRISRSKSTAPGVAASTSLVIRQRPA